MASDIEVINLALSNIRASSINSLTEGSLQAQVAKLKYPFMRDRLLKETVWQFNRKLKPLSLLTIDLFNWAFTYQYPVDCLKIHRLVPAFEEIAAGSADVVSRRRESELRSLKDQRPQVPFAVFNEDGNKVIGSDDQELRIDYAAKVTDPNLFSDDFILALSHLLAAEMAIPLIGAETGRQLRSDEMTLYQAYLDSAIADDMNDGYHTPPESEFILVRG
jgi:hypothetical protein